MDKEFPDLQYKMSKKIAQLTKVIYHLNSRNDDYEQEIHQTSLDHDNEIEYILKDACRRLNEFQEDINLKHEQIKQNKALETLQAMHETEKQNFLAQFEKYKEEARAAQEALVKKYETQTMFITRDLENMKGQFIEKVKHFSELSQEMQNGHSVALEQLRVSHKQELLELSRQKEEEQAQALIILKENHAKLMQDQRDALRAQFDQKIAEERQQFARSKKELESMLQSTSSSSLQTQKDSFDATLAEIRASHSEQLQKMENEKSELANQVQELQTILANARETIERLEAKLQHEASSNSALALELQNSIDRTISDHQHRINELHSQLESANSKYTEMEEYAQKMAKQAKDQTESLSEQFQQKLFEMSRSKENESLMVSELKKNLDALTDDLKRAQREAALLQQEKENMQAQTAVSSSDMAKQLSLLMEEHRREADSWKAELAALNDELSKRAEIASSSAASMKLLSAKHEEEVQTLKTSFAKELAQKDSVLKSLKHQLEESQAKITQLNKDSENSSDKMRSDALQSRKELEKARADHSRQIYALETSIQSKDNEIKELQQQNSVHLSSIESLKSLLAQVEKESQSQLADDLSSLKQKLNVEWSEKLRLSNDALRAELEAKYAQAKQEYLNLLAQKDKIIAGLEDTAANLRRNVDDYNVLAKNQNAHVEQLSDAFKKMELEKNDAIKQSEEAWQTRMNELRKSLEEEYKEKEKRNEEQFIAKQKEWESAVTNRMQSISSYHDKLVAEMVAVHKKNISELTEQMDAKWMNEVLQKEKDRQRREEELIRSLKKEKDMALANLQEENKQELRPLQLSTESKNEKIRDLESKIADMQAQYKSSAEEMKRLKGDIDAKDNDITMLRKENSESMKELHKKLRVEHDQVIADLKEENHCEMEKIIFEHNQAYQLLEEKCAALEQQLVEADLHYKNRSPREQDLEIIRRLRSEVSDHVDYINKLKADQKYMRLELQNREESFNKIFNKTPQIGPPTMSTKFYEGTSTVSPPMSTSSSKGPNTPPKLPPLSASARGSREKTTSKDSPKTKF